MGVLPSRTLRGREPRGRCAAPAVPRGVSIPEVGTESTIATVSILIPSQPPTIS
jgi:hypothetical protein